MIAKKNLLYSIFGARNCRLTRSKDIGGDLATCNVLLDRSFHYTSISDAIDQWMGHRRKMGYCPTHKKVVGYGMPVSHSFTVHKIRRDNRIMHEAHCIGCCRAGPGRDDSVITCAY